MALQATGAPTITLNPADHNGFDINGNTWTYTNSGSGFSDTNSAKYNNNQLIWTESNGIYTVQRKVGSGGTAENFNGFNIRFSNNADHESTLLPLTIETWGDSTNKKAGLLVSNNVTAFTLDFGNKGFRLGGEGDAKKWGFHFQSTGITATIDNLSSLDGSIHLLGDVGARTNTLTINLGSMTGNITMEGNTLGNQQIQFNFDGTGLQGDIAAANITGGTTGNSGSEVIGGTVDGAYFRVDFTNNVTMTGDIKGLGARKDSQKRTITFNSTTDTALDGNIFSYGTGAHNSDYADQAKAGNDVIFQKGNMVGSVIASQGNIVATSIRDSADGEQESRGYNHLTFSSGSNQTLTGGILAQAYDLVNNDKVSNATNELTIGEGTTLKIVADSSNVTQEVTDENVAYIDYTQSAPTSGGSTSKRPLSHKNIDFSVTTGSITAQGFGRNVINITQGATLVLNDGNGSIVAKNNENSNPNIGGSTQRGDGQAQSIINFKGTGGTLQGNITTEAGTATINIADTASGTITGSITKSGSGANNITYVSSSTTGSLTLKGATNTISTLTTTTQSGGASTLNIDASANSNSTSISTISGAKLVVNFNSTQDNTATLSLTTTGAGLTIKDIDITAGEKNILILGGRDTATISDDVTITTGKGITFDLSSGSNINFSGSGGITTAGTTTFKLGGENTITGTLTNNGTHNFVISKDTTLKYSTTGLTFTGGNNNINFTDNATLDWKSTSGQSKAIATSGSSTTTINVANTKNGTINDSITTTAGSTNIVLGSATGLLDAPAPTPTTLTLKGTSNAITLITANDSNSTLSLVAEGHNNTTTLGSVSGDNKLTVNFNGKTSGSDKYTAKLTLNGNANLKAITLGASSTNNTLEIASGNTRVNDNFSLTTGQEMSFDVKTNANLAFANGLSNSGGTLNLTSTGTSGAVSQTTVSGNITTTDGNTNLYFKDSLWAPASLSTREVASSGVVTVSGGTSNIAVDLGSDSGVTQMPIYNVITRDGENNILVKGPTHIGANVTYGANGKTNLIFVSGSDDVVATLSAGANLTNPDNGISMFGKTFSNGVLLTLQDVNVASGSSTASFLSLAGKDGSTPVFSFTTQRDTGTNTDTVNLNGVAVGEIQAIGGTAIQDPSTPQTHTYNVVLNKDAVFAGKIALYGTNQVINLTMEDSSKLFVNNSALHLENLKINSPRLDTSNLKTNSFNQNNVVIDLATDGNSFENIKRDIGTNGYRVLAIGSKTQVNSAQPDPTGLSGNNGLFRVYVDPNTEGKLGQGVSSADSAFTNYQAKADRVFVNSGTEGKHYIQAIYSEGTIIDNIAYHGGGVENGENIAVATVAKSTNITFEGAEQIQGFEIIATELTDGGISTNAEGKEDSSGAYKTYFIGSTVSKGVSSSAIQTASSALGINYDLFLANFNSLNKRMGELRDNNNGQGAWARVFVGGLSTSYGLGTQSTYTTIQAGYDYAFGFEGANNYLGVALSYANALTDTKQAFDINGVVSGIDKTTTNGVEVALYNAYVEDSGWFNDTIFKFSYMMSDVKVINQSDTYSTNNFGIVLSDEFGYRFKLGESKEWYIDPQLEVGFGYFNQSDLKQVLGQATLDGIQDAIVTLRARVGANWAYDFKNFTQGKGINASVYLGTYYSYDYINGGEINLTTNSGTNTNLTPLSSTGRFEINVGTNIEVQNNTRIYFDFEKSFGGDITTDYQVNLGVRYSFGENAGYTPSNGDKKSITPLKVNDENAKESEEAQEQVSEANKESANSQNNKTEESTEAKSEDKAQ